MIHKNNTIETITKITTSITYKTTDGRIFDSKAEAEAWQSAIDTLDQSVMMLKHNFELTSDIEMAYYVYIANKKQLEAFNLKQSYLGLDSFLHEPGYYYYDDEKDEYVNIEKKICTMQDIMQKLDESIKHSQEDTYD